MRLIAITIAAFAALWFARVPPAEAAPYYCPSAHSFIPADQVCPESPPDAVPSTQLSNRAPAGPDQQYAEGAADRATWEIWLNGQVGDYRAGAFYWSGQRSLPHPGSCEGSDHPKAWSDGCMAARAYLSLPDARRRSEPKYKAGWNSFTVAAPASVSALPTVAQQRSGSNTANAPNAQTTIQEQLDEKKNQQLVNIEIARKTQESASEHLLDVERQYVLAFDRLGHRRHIALCLGDTNGMSQVAYDEQDIYAAIKPALDTLTREEWIAATILFQRTKDNATKFGQCQDVEDAIHAGDAAAKAAHMKDLLGN